MNKKPGYIDARRLRIGGVPQWAPVPSTLIPGVMEAYGIYEEFLGLETLNIGGHTKDWEYLIQNAAVLSQADLAGGGALITCGGANNDLGQITLGGLAAGGAYFCAANAHLWFEARVRVGLVAVGTLNYFIGLIDPANAAYLADNGGALPLPDMLAFCAVDGDVNWSFVGDRAAAQDLNPLTALCVIDGNWHTFGFYVNGLTDVTVYYDRVAQPLGAVTTLNMPLLGVMPAIAVKAGVAIAETIEVDYVMCVQLRV